MYRPRGVDWRLCFLLAVAATQASRSRSRRWAASRVNPARVADASTAATSCCSERTLEVSHVGAACQRGGVDKKLDRRWNHNIHYYDIALAAAPMARTALDVGTGDAGLGRLARLTAPGGTLVVIGCAAVRPRRTTPWNSWAQYNTKCCLAGAATGNTMRRCRWTSRTLIHSADKHLDNDLPVPLCLDPHRRGRTRTVGEGMRTLVRGCS